MILYELIHPDFKEPVRTSADVIHRIIPNIRLPCYLHEKQVLIQGVHITIKNIGNIPHYHIFYGTESRKEIETLNYRDALNYYLIFEYTGLNPELIEE